MIYFSMFSHLIITTLETGLKKVTISKIHYFKK